MTSVIQIDWERIRDIWTNQLWPGRSSAIRTHSSMQYQGGYDMTIYDNPVQFWGIKKDGLLVAVNSGFRTRTGLYRSRGLWVDPAHRRQGYSALLFDAVFDQARAEMCEEVWSYPRKTAVQAYLSYGFRQTSAFLQDGEFGPNCYVISST